MRVSMSPTTTWYPMANPEQQCAAVSTHSSFTMDPPQMWRRGASKNSLTETCQGISPGSALVPPMMRLLGPRGKE